GPRLLDASQYGPPLLRLCPARPDAAQGSHHPPLRAHPGAGGLRHAAARPLGGDGGDLRLDALTRAELAGVGLGSLKPPKRRKRPERTPPAGGKGWKESRSCWG